MRLNTTDNKTCRTIDGLHSVKHTTEEAANQMRVVPQTLRAALCRHGHYLGMRPVKLPNGKLLWDASEVQRLLAGEVL